MNKRIRKKNSIERLNTLLDIAFSMEPLFDRIEKEYLIPSNIDYDIWYESNSCKRLWSYLRKKCHLPKIIGYKNKTIRY